MPNGLTGLSGLAGYQQLIDRSAQATPEDRSGNPANPRHAHPQDARPYPWESQQTMAGSHGPYGPENQLLGDEWWFFHPGGSGVEDPTYDAQPITRAAPFPKGISSGPVPGATPDDIADQLRQSAYLHSIKTGASNKLIRTTLGDVTQDDWQELWEVNPGHSELVSLPKQAMASGFMWGTTDRTQSMARQNEHGFDSAHMHRRYAAGSIPGNNMWMRPGGRPLHKSIAGPARPAIGPDSPFHGDDLGAAFGARGAVLSNLPSEYTPPPQPALSSGYSSDSQDAYVEWY